MSLKTTEQGKLEIHRVQKGKTGYPEKSSEEALVKLYIGYGEPNVLDTFQLSQRDNDRKCTTSPLISRVERLQTTQDAGPDRN